MFRDRKSMNELKILNLFLLNEKVVKDIKMY